MPAAKPAPVAVKANTSGIEYNRDIRPILAENCFACHGPDSAARKAGLRLDRREDAIEAKAIVPGKPTESEMIRRILAAADDKELMPPPKSNKKLKPEQKALLKKWVEAGAEYQPHWSFLAADPPGRAGGEGQELGAEPDRRLRSGEARSGRAEAGPGGRPPHPRPPARARPHRPAARRRPTWRRSSTTSREMWYEKYVEKLLASPQWGEHRGRYWLDYARYADTHGIHFDNFREIWAYRDWVINAFNKNQPFDQFTIEQLAGDLLPEPDARPAASPPASTGATSPPARAGRSTRSTSSCTPATAPRRHRRCGWG